MSTYAVVEFDVHLMAFRNDEVRKVDVPLDVYGKAYREDRDNVLDLIFRYGQNDFQPRPFCSVSMGDVIDLFGILYLVEFVGFRKMSREEFAAYKAMDRRDRYAVSEFNSVFWNGSAYEKVGEKPAREQYEDDKASYEAERPRNLC
jgi:hypothetical protein